MTVTRRAGTPEPGRLRYSFRLDEYSGLQGIEAAALRNNPDFLPSCPKKHLDLKVGQLPLNPRETALHAVWFAIPAERDFDVSSSNISVRVHCTGSSAGRCSLASLDFCFRFSCPTTTQRLEERLLTVTKAMANPVGYEAAHLVPDILMNTINQLPQTPSSNYPTTAARPFPFQAPTIQGWNAANAVQPNPLSSPESYQNQLHRHQQEQLQLQLQRQQTKVEEERRPPRSPYSLSKSSDKISSAADLSASVEAAEDVEASDETQNAEKKSSRILLALFLSLLLAAILGVVWYIYRKRFYRPSSTARTA
eukprot:GHVT01018237.1.p1 GENE.GHVT01018237.1~~GHVT01018237.1.p1  ORF type:complete len:329 (+),score=36.90 GHVT01018237.1:66-989(+)